MLQTSAEEPFAERLSFAGSSRIRMDCMLMGTDQPKSVEEPFVEEPFAE